VRDKVPYRHKTTSKILFLHILIFVFKNWRTNKSTVATGCTRTCWFYTGTGFEGLKFVQKIIICLANVTSVSLQKEPHSLFEGHWKS
jgi:F0F1-type ATP synthase assembly protein I